MALLSGGGGGMIAMIVIYVLVAFNLLMAANMHGKSKGEWSLPASVIAQILSLLLIWWAIGGRFI